MPLPVGASASLPRGGRSPGGLTDDSDSRDGVRGACARGRAAEAAEGGGRGAVSAVRGSIGHESAFCGPVGQGSVAVWRLGDGTAAWGNPEAEISEGRAVDHNSHDETGSGNCGRRNEVVVEDDGDALRVGAAGIDEQDALAFGVVRGVATGIIWDGAPASICADGESTGGRRYWRIRRAAIPTIGIPVDGPATGPLGGRARGHSDLSEGEVAGHLAGTDGSMAVPCEESEEEGGLIATIEVYTPGVGAEPRVRRPRGSAAAGASEQGRLGAQAQAARGLEAHMSLPLRQLLGL